MSGRVRVRQPDGRITTGYRKTDRRNPRAADAGEPVEHRLVFMMPREFWAVPDGVQPANDAIEVGRMRNVTVKGMGRDYVLERAAKFIQAHGAGHPYLAVSAVMEHGGRRDGVQIVLVRGNVIAFYGRGRHFVFPGAAR